MKIIKFCLVSCALLCLIPGCSIDQLAINKVADILSQDGGTVFTGDNDPELIGDALPFALKLYESLLDSAPEHRKLLLATGKAFCLYAYAYVQIPAEMLPDEDLELRDKLLSRAKALFLRGKAYIFRAIDLEIPQFTQLLENKETAKALSLITKKDVPFVYWGAAAWLGAFTTDLFDMELLLASSTAVMLLEKTLEIDAAYEMGSAHELLVSYYGTLPEAMGGSEEKARMHFDKALAYSKGRKAAPYLNLATSVCVKKQDIDEFKKLLDTALKIDLNASPENRLMNRIAQEKAVWMLVNIENWFLIDSDDVLLREYEEEFLSDAPKEYNKDPDL